MVLFLVITVSNKFPYKPITLYILESELLLIYINRISLVSKLEIFKVKKKKIPLWANEKKNQNAS